MARRFHEIPHFFSPCLMTTEGISHDIPYISHIIPIGLLYLMEESHITHHCLLNHHEINVQLVQFIIHRSRKSSTFRSLPAVHSARSDHGFLGPSRAGP